jgi:hypothetical protein
LLQRDISGQSMPENKTNGTYHTTAVAGRDQSSLFRIMFREY